MVHLILMLTIILAVSKYKNIRLTGCSFLILALFAVLRYDYGNDYNSYIKAYNSINHGIDVFVNEKLFTLLNKITPNFYVLIAITSLFFTYVIYRLVSKHLIGGFQGLAVLIFVINPYLFLMNLSAIRQCIAMCIFILAVKFLQDRKPIPYVVMILIASMFHLSALVLLPVYLFVNDKAMSKIQVFLLATAMILLLVEGGLVTSLMETGLTVLDNSEYAYQYSEGLKNSLRATLLTGIYFLYVALNLSYLKGYKLICGKMYLIGLFLGMLAIHFSMITRIQMYFDIFSIITIPSIMEYHLNAAEEGWKKIINLYFFPILLLMIYAARYYTFFTNPMWSPFGTYHTIFEAIL